MKRGAIINKILWNVEKLNKDHTTKQKPADFMTSVFLHTMLDLTLLRNPKDLLEQFKLDVLIHHTAQILHPISIRASESGLNLWKCFGDKELKDVVTG